MNEPKDNPRKPRRTWKRGPIQKSESDKADSAYSKDCATCGDPVAPGQRQCGKCLFGDGMEGW